MTDKDLHHRSSCWSIYDVYAFYEYVYEYMVMNKFMNISKQNNDNNKVSDKDAV